MLVILPFSGEILFLIAYVCICLYPCLQSQVVSAHHPSSRGNFNDMFPPLVFGKSSIPMPMLWNLASKMPVFPGWYLVANYPRIVSGWKKTVISGLTLLIPFTTGIITHLLSGMSHQVVYFLHSNFQLFYLFWGCFPVKHAGNPWARYLPAPFLRLELLRVPARAKPTRRLKTSKNLGDHRWLSLFSVLL